MEHGPALSQACHSCAHSECEDRVLDGPASWEKGSQGGPYKFCNPRTCMNYPRGGFPTGRLRAWGAWSTTRQQSCVHLQGLPRN